MIKVPFNSSSSSDQSFQILLKEKEMVSMRVTWSERQQRWHMSLNMSKSIYGLKLVENLPLLYLHKVLSPIEGDFIVLPIVANPSPLGYDNLGKEWGIIYLTADEVSDWKAHNGIR